MTSYHTSAIPAVPIYSESQKYLYFLVAGNIIVLISYINLFIAFFLNRGPNIDRALTTLPMQRDSSDAEHNEANIIVDPLQTYSDIKICYSTVSGYSSHRDAMTGSWYIESMSRIFYKYSHDTHLENLLKLISEEMKDYVGENNEMQTPCNEDIGFSKKLYFNPGFYES